MDGTQPLDPIGASAVAETPARAPREGERRRMIAAPWLHGRPPARPGNLAPGTRAILHAPRLGQIKPSPPFPSITEPDDNPMTTVQHRKASRFVRRSIDPSDRLRTAATMLPPPAGGAPDRTRDGMAGEPGAASRANGRVPGRGLAGGPAGEAHRG